ncbi:MAG: nitroreductase family protein [Candidatus Bathyarchaeia archaeon]
MDFYEVVRTRRSVRSFKPDPIPEAVIKRVLDAARIAPSGSNRQPWKFILIEEGPRKEEVAKLCHGQGFVAKAPLVIVACGRRIDFNRGDYMGDMSMLVDVSIAVDHLVLAARAEGLGSCWIGAFDNSALKRLLGIPEDYNVVAVIPIGYPSHDAFRETSDRKPLEEIICYERFR